MSDNVFSEDEKVLYANSIKIIKIYLSVSQNNLYIKPLEFKNRNK